MARLSYRELLVRYLGPQRGRVAVLATLLIGGIALRLINPQLVRRFLDSAETGRSLDELLVTAGLFMGVALLAQVVKLAAAYVGEVVAWIATNELRADLAMHCLKLDMSFHKTHKPGELIERVDGDVNQLATFFSQLVIQLVSNVLLLAGVLVLLWLVDPWVGATVTALAVASVVVLRVLNKRVVPLWQVLRQVEADLFGYLEEWLTGTEEIQTSGGAPYVMRELVGLMRRRWRAMQAAMRLNLLVMALPILVPTLAYIAAYLWGAALFRDSRLTVGSVYLIIYYIDVIKDPLWVIQRQVQDLQRAGASINRIAELFALRSAIADGPGADLPDGPLTVSFDGVSFSYDDGADVLSGVGFSLEAGRVLGLLGRTGSGKTTLTRLIFRLYDPTSGAIRLADRAGTAVDLRTATQAAVRRRIGLVTQEVQLFHASVRDNLTMFDETVADEQVHAALDELGLAAWAAALPEGLDTKLEAGDGLSAGEAQLLALARVFLADPDLVILDEASSRLDPATESLLERALDTLLVGRTAVIIAHRLSTVDRADEIMILDGGRVAEHGERAALAADPGSRFSRLLSTGLEEALA